MPKVDLNTVHGQVSIDLMTAKEHELRLQLKSLLDRGILVCYQTPMEHNFDGNKCTVSQRIGLKVETEEYISKLEKELKAARECVEYLKKLAGLSKGSYALDGIPYRELDCLVNYDEATK